MAFCPLVHYSSDSSLEVDQPETVELQSDQEPTPETQHSAAVRASSSPNRDSPGQEAHQSDSAHQQPSIPVSATNRRNPYALELSQLPAHLRTFLNSVKTYFTQKFNLQRQKAPLSPSTYDKAQERMLCFLGYVRSTLSDRQLTADCFLRVSLIEGYVEFLKVRIFVFRTFVQQTTDAIPLRRGIFSVV